jgi:plasmid stability protein
MTVAITIRNVPEKVRDELAARAALSGRSLQEYLLSQFVESTSRPTVESVVARARERLRLTGTRVDSAAILADRDADRR